jgi:hypothetical protein
MKLPSSFVFTITGRSEGRGVPSSEALIDVNPEDDTVAETVNSPSRAAFAKADFIATNFSLAVVPWARVGTKRSETTRAAAMAVEENRIFSIVGSPKV